MAQRNAASVLPEPVGAWMRVCAPEAMAGQPWAWAAVGPANAELNQSLVASEKPASGSTAPGYPGPVTGFRGSSSMALKRLVRLRAILQWLGIFQGSRLLVEGSGE
jgi:hypothetical protein